MKSGSTVEYLHWLDRRWYEQRVSQKEAEAFCQRLARSHYENFTVASFLLPRRLHQHFSNIYAYCRVSDDLADELPDPQIALQRLEEWREHLQRCYNGEASHPVFIALKSTIAQFGIPKDPFENLLKAFCQDQVKTRYSTWQDLLEYCSNSANPVGHLVLYLCGYRDGYRQALSDHTCTALQLANFWQDVARDYARGRIYIPQELLLAHLYSEEMLARKIVNESWIGLMQELIERTRRLFSEGMLLCSTVHGRVRLDIELFSRGGLEVLRAIERIDYDTLHHRPELSWGKKTRLLFGALWGSWVKVLEV